MGIWDIYVIIIINHHYILTINHYIPIIIKPV